MFKKEFILIRPIAMVFDFLAILLSFITAYHLRIYLLKIIPFGSQTSLGDYYGLILSIILLWWCFFNLDGAYLNDRFSNLKQEYHTVIKTVCFGTLIILSGAFLLKSNTPPRSVIILFAVVNLLILCIEKKLLFKWFGYLRSRGYHKITAVIVGGGKMAERLLSDINGHPALGIDIVGLVCPVGNRAISDKLDNTKVLGTAEDFVKILHRNPVDEVIFAVAKGEANIDGMLAACRQEGIKVRIMMELLSEGAKNINVEKLLGHQFLTVSHIVQQEWQIFLKRLLDIAGSLIALIILSPVFVIIGLLIKLDDGGPLFYRWQVVGLNQKPFTSWKFRSMVVDADKLKKKLLSKNEMQGAVFKMKNDPRITRVGKWLRKFSIDELPQLYSVLKGDMSLVGPRPPLVTEVNRFNNMYRRKLSVKPGITCLWQVQGRNRIHKLEQWIKLDLEYIDNWSLWLDFKILFKTVGVVISGTGE